MKGQETNFVAVHSFAFTVLGHADHSHRGSRRPQCASTTRTSCDSGLTCKYRCKHRLSPVSLRRASSLTCVACPAGWSALTVSSEETWTLQWPPGSREHGQMCSHMPPSLWILFYCSPTSETYSVCCSFLITDRSKSRPIYAVTKEKSKIFLPSFLCFYPIYMLF